MAWCRDSGVLLLCCLSGSADGSGELQQIQQQLLQVSLLKGRHHHIYCFFFVVVFLIFRYFWLVSLSCSRDCLALCCLNSATSIFAGFAVFSVLGFMAQDLNISLEDISAGGKIIAYKEVKWSFLNNYLINYSCKHAVFSFCALKF